MNIWISGVGNALFYRSSNFPRKELIYNRTSFNKVSGQEYVIWY